MGRPFHNGAATISEGLIRAGTIRCYKVLSAFHPKKFEVWQHTATANNRGNRKEFQFLELAFLILTEGPGQNYTA